jgi:serine/threonine-protein kinase
VELATGDILGGKYRVERLLGRGGVGAVFAATHLELDELVAIKVLHGDAQSAKSMARFQREARAAVRLKSQHVARVLDVDRLPNGGRYMVLEYLEGQDLHRLVRQRGRIPMPYAATYILQACEGLAEAHALGMVHRDIKLQNLFLTTGADGAPLVKILDFGMVKVSRAETGETGVREKEASLTDPSTIIGSLRYMAPEQLRGEGKLDARADVWALGVCLHYLISGEPPFPEEHLGALYAAISGRPVTRLDAIDKTIPSELADLVEHALEKNVTRRFQDVRELAEALEPFGVDAGTVVGIAWRIKNVLRPRVVADAPPPSLAPEEADADDEAFANTAEADAPPEMTGAIVENTAPLERPSGTNMEPPPAAIAAVVVTES